MGKLLYYTKHINLQICSSNICNTILMHSKYSFFDSKTDFLLKFGMINLRIVPELIVLVGLKQKSTSNLHIICEKNKHLDRNSLKACFHILYWTISSHFI